MFEINLDIQASCEIKPGYTPEDLAEKIHILEHQHYPKVIEEFILSEKPLTSLNSLMV